MTVMDVAPVVYPEISGRSQIPLLIEGMEELQWTESSDSRVWGGVGTGSSGTSVLRSPRDTAPARLCGAVPRGVLAERTCPDDPAPAPPHATPRNARPRWRSSRWRRRSGMGRRTPRRSSLGITSTIMAARGSGFRNGGRQLAEDAALDGARREPPERERCRAAEQRHWGAAGDRGRRALLLQQGGGRGAGRRTARRLALQRADGVTRSAGPPLRRAVR